MFVLVLTGGLGAGKSTAAEYFRSRGATVVDLDEVAARVMVKGSPLLDRIAAEFGPDVLYADGSLDRAALARIAFATPADAKRLNAIVHPTIAGEVGPAMRELEMLPMRPEVVVLEVPLLAEAPVYRELADAVLAIVAPMHLRVARAVADGFEEADVIRRIRAQATDAERAALADAVIVNDADQEIFVSALGRYWDEYVAPRRDDVQ